jgi:hypothetical protein
MDARTNFKSGIAYDDLREWLALADPRLPPEARRGRHDPFGRHHRCLQALPLAPQVPAQQCAERRGGAEGTRTVRLAA